MNVNPKAYAEAEKAFTEAEDEALDIAIRTYLSALPAAERLAMSEGPIPMLLWCPECGARHIDEGEFATKVHHTHACQSCGMVWRPAVVPTCGVNFLPGFKNEVTP
jgi:predicted RNA-binding Zn-ribbon protein involved in translation (DUF1610 family)